MELWNHFGSPRVQTALCAVTRGPKKPPKAFWHMRQWQMEGRPSRVTRKRTAPHWQPPAWASAWGMTHCFYVVAIGIDDKGTVIVLVIMRAKARRAIVGAACG
ncbi:hypothetical protein D3C87_1704060 [compost metagenome]